MKNSVKVLIDVVHAAATIFLGITSWAALFPGFEEQFNRPIAIFLMILINIIFDVGAFVFGAQFANQSKKYSERNLTMGIIAFVLHLTSFFITFFGADIAAKMMVSDESIDLVVAQAVQEEDRIKAKNEVKVIRWEQSKAVWEGNKDKRVSEAISSYRTELKALQDQEWVARTKREDLEESARLARKIIRLQDTHKKTLLGLRSGEFNIPYPELEIASNGNIDRAEEKAVELKSQQAKIAKALKFTDVFLLMVVTLWLVAVWYNPSLGGRSYIVSLFALPFAIIKFVSDIIDEIIMKIDIKAWVKRRKKNGNGLSTTFYDTQERDDQILRIDKAYEEKFKDLVAQFEYDKEALRDKIDMLEWELRERTMIFDRKEALWLKEENRLRNLQRQPSNTTTTLERQPQATLDNPQGNLEATLDEKGVASELQPSDPERVYRQPSEGFVWGFRGATLLIEIEGKQIPRRTVRTRWYSAKRKYENLGRQSDYERMMRYWEAFEAISEKDGKPISRKSRNSMTRHLLSIKKVGDDQK